MKIRNFQAEDSDQVIALWQESGLTRPWNDPLLDIERKQKLADDLFLVGVDSTDRIIASVMGGYDGHRGWMNYLAVAPAHRRHGLAGALIENLEGRLVQAGCPKINLQIRTDNVEVRAFYESLGFTEDAVISMGKRLISDE